MKPRTHRLTQFGLEVRGQLSDVEWLALGQRVSVHRSGIFWALGDWLLARPREESWRKTYRSAQNIFPSYSKESLSGYKRVSEAFEGEDRRLGLAWSFYRAALSLDAEQRMPALRQALATRVSYHEFGMWVRRQMQNLPVARLFNTTNRSVGRGRPGARRSGSVMCPHCGHRFRVRVEPRTPVQPEKAA